MTTHLVTYNNTHVSFHNLCTLKSRPSVVCCLLRELSQGQNQGISQAAFSSVAQTPLAVVGLRCLTSCWLWSGSHSQLLDTAFGSQSRGTLRTWPLLQNQWENFTLVCCGGVWYNTTKSQEWVFSSLLPYNAN